MRDFRHQKFWRMIQAIVTASYDLLGVINSNYYRYNIITTPCSKEIQTGVYTSVPNRLSTGDELSFSASVNPSPTASRISFSRSSLRASAPPGRLGDVDVRPGISIFERPGASILIAAVGPRLLDWLAPPPILGLVLELRGL